MTRYFLSCLALTACLIGLSGCGGTDAEFEASEAPTVSEEQAAEEYTDAMDPEKMQEAMKTGKDPFPLNN